MKKYWLLLGLFLILSNVLYAETYNGTMPKDLDVTTPYGTSAPSVIDNAVREHKIVYINEHNVVTTTGSYTATGTNTVIIGSSTGGILITFPTASTVATSTAFKEFIIKNKAVGTMTLSITLDGVGSPTVGNNNSRRIFTDGTNWFESTRIQSAGNADTLGSVSASGYARSGANTDITSLGALTSPYMAQTNGTATNPQLASVQISSGSATLSGVASPYVAQVNGTASLTSATISTVSIVGGTATLSGVASPYMAQTNGTATGITLNNTTFSGTFSGVSHDSITGTGTNSHSAIDTFIVSKASASGLASLDASSLVVQNPANATSTATASKIAIADGSGKLDTWITGGTSKVTSWVGTNSVTGTGTLYVTVSGDLTLTTTYGSGKGTWTFGLAGSATAKPDCKVGGVVKVSNPTAYDFPVSYFTAAASGNDAVLTFVPSGLVAQTNGTATGATLNNTTLNGTLSTKGYEWVFDSPTVGHLLQIGTNNTIINATATTSATVFVRTGTTISPGTITDALCLGTTTQYNNSVLTVLGSDTSPLTIKVFASGKISNAEKVAISPIMTDSTTPSPAIITKSGQYSTYHSWQAFDQDLNTWWGITSGGLPGWIAFDAGTGTTHIVRQYKVATGEQPYRPVDFSLQGSTDNINFTTIDTRTSQAFTANVYNTYTIATSTTPYQFYRLYVTACGGIYLDVSELLLQEYGSIETALHINGSGTVLIGTATSFSTSTACLLVGVQGGGAALFDAFYTYSTEGIKLIFPKKEKSEYLKDLKNLRIETWYLKTNKFSDMDAENYAKQKFINEKDEIWEAENISKYKIITSIGSLTAGGINYDKLRKDCIANKEIEWNSLTKSEKNQRINEIKIQSGGDVSKINISLIVDDPSTPAYMKGKGGNTRDLGSELGAVEMGVQELISIMEEQQKEIDWLKARIP